MTVVGRINSVWRYPVKSMRGEELDEAFVGFGGLRGDRVYAIHNANGPQEFPYFTAREQGQLLRYRANHRGGGETDLTIETFGGDTFDITDPRLLATAAAGLPDRFNLTLLKSDKALTDCHPVSLISSQTVTQLSSELGAAVDKRRFRANLYVELTDKQGFGENNFVGRKLRIGRDVLLPAVERDVRCKMITLDPDTFQPNPELMKVVARSHDGCAGIYASVIAEGVIRPGDPVEVLD